MSGFFSKFIYVFCKKSPCPYFGGIPQVNRFLAGYVYDPCLFIVFDLCIAATARSIKKCILDAALEMRYCDRKGIPAVCMTPREWEGFFSETDEEKEWDAGHSNRVLEEITDFYRWLKGHGKTERVPALIHLYWKKEIPVHHDRSVSGEDRKRLHKALPYFPEELRLMYLHLYALGLRINEVCTLKAGNYYAREGICWLRVYQHKMRNEKAIPIPEQLYERMQDYIRVHDRSAGEYVFQNRKGEAYSVETFKDQMKRLCGRYGVNTDGYHFRSHDLRHTVATDSYKRGVPMPVIRDFLGHQSADMTRQYIDYMPEELKRKSREYFERHGWEEDGVE